jgi:hypothetical protein
MTGALSRAHPAKSLDGIDRALRQQLPEVAEVFIDLTSHRASPREDG